MIGLVVRADNALHVPVTAINLEVWNLLTGLRGAPEADADTERREILRRLVMGDIVEVLIDGVWQSGPAPLAKARDPHAADDGMELRRLSAEAIMLAYKSPREHSWELLNLLYYFNRAPLSPRLKRSLPDEAACLRFLGIANGSCRIGGRRFDLPLRLSHNGRGWRTWRRQGNGPTRQVMDARHKVYISPQLEQLPMVFRTTCALAFESSAASLKIGASLTELLRPDKMVVYFARASDAQAFARRVLTKMPHVRAQGVPFSWQFGSTALVSLGVDPLGASGHSWRTWVCEAISTAILSARRRASLDPQAFVSRRLEAIGVDTERWMPKTSCRL
ncbi:MAG: hypothetical protein HY923_02610 [Elusimicrobia bacterium]|nr:hypothetical protein [Elusimicrobiota bacterium]